MAEIKGKLKSRLSGFFFEQAKPETLGICRFLFCGFIFVYYLNADFAGWGFVPRELWHPIFLFDILDIPVFSPAVLRALGFIWLFCLLSSAVGFLSRLSLPAAFFVGFYLLGIANSFSETHHMETVVLFALAVLAFSRCGDGFSADRFLADRRGKKAPSPSWEYVWPGRLIQVLMTFFFCAAGFSKLRNSGLEWIFSDNLSRILISNALVGNRAEPLFEWLPFWLAEKRSLCVLLAGLTVALETLAPLALLGRRFKAVIVPGLFFMMAGFWVVMGLAFPQWMAAFVFWLPWDGIVGRARLGKGLN